jgi:hypothetical protein
MEQRRQAICEIVEQNQPCPVRGVFYQMVAHGLIEKTEAGCAKVQDALLKLRMDGEVSWDWIVDESRIFFKQDAYASPEEALREWQAHYRRDLWADAPVTVQVWIEKRALAGLFTAALFDFCVPVFPSVGYTSDSFVRSAVSHIDARPVFIYYFGDYDPSGANISEVLERKLYYHAQDACIVFQRVAVNREQIEEWDLPTRPTKKTDSRAKRFGDDRSVELDAVPPTILRDLALGCVTNHLSADLLERTLKVEEAERESLEAFTAKWPSFRSKRRPRSG